MDFLFGFFTLARPLAHCILTFAHIHIFPPDQARSAPSAVGCRVDGHDAIQTERVNSTGGGSTRPFMAPWLLVCTRG